MSQLNDPAIQAIVAELERDGRLEEAESILGVKLRPQTEPQVAPLRIKPSAISTFIGGEIQRGRERVLGETFAGYSEQGSQNNKFAAAGGMALNIGDTVASFLGSQDAKKRVIARTVKDQALREIDPKGETERQIARTIGGFAATAPVAIATGAIGAGAGSIIAAGAGGTAAGVTAAGFIGGTLAGELTGAALAYEGGNIVGSKTPVKDAIDGTTIGTIKTFGRWVTGDKDLTLEDKLGAVASAMLTGINGLEAYAVAKGYGNKVPQRPGSPVAGGSPDAPFARRATGSTYRDFVDQTPELNGSVDRNGWSASVRGGDWGDFHAKDNVEVEFTNPKTGQKASAFKQDGKVYVKDGSKIYSVDIDADGNTRFTDVTKTYKPKSKSIVVREDGQPGGSRSGEDPGSMLPGDFDERFRTYEAQTAEDIDAAMRSTPQPEDPEAPLLPESRIVMAQKRPTNDRGGRLPSDLNRMPSPERMKLTGRPFKLPTEVKDIDTLRDTVQRNTPFVILTAGAPRTERTAKLLPGENYDQALLRQLRERFGEENVAEVRGVYKGEPEGAPSYMVVNANDTDAVDLLAAFGQESLVSNRGMVYQDGSYHPRTPGSDVFGDAAGSSDFYSAIQTPDGEMKFALGYDFDQRLRRDPFGGEIPNEGISDIDPPHVANEVVKPRSEGYPDIPNEGAGGIYEQEPPRNSFAFVVPTVDEVGNGANIITEEISDYQTMDNLVASGMLPDGNYAVGDQLVRVRGGRQFTEPGLDVTYDFKENRFVVTKRNVDKSVFYHGSRKNSGVQRAEDLRPGSDWGPLGPNEYRAVYATNIKEDADSFSYGGDVFELELADGAKIATPKEAKIAINKHLDMDAEKAILKEGYQAVGKKDRRGEYWEIAILDPSIIRGRNKFKATPVRGDVEAMAADPKIENINRAADSFAENQHPGEKNKPFKEAVKKTTKQMFFDFMDGAGGAAVQALALGISVAEVARMFGYDFSGLLGSIGSDLNMSAIGVGALLFSRIRPNVAKHASANFVATELFKTLWQAGKLVGKKRWADVVNEIDGYQKTLSASVAKVAKSFRDVGADAMADFVEQNAGDIIEASDAINNRRMAVYARMGSKDPKDLTVNHVYEILGMTGRRVKQGGQSDVRMDPAYQVEFMQRFLESSQLDPKVAKEWAEWYKKDIALYRQVTRMLLPDLARGEKVNVKLPSGTVANMYGNEFIQTILLAITSPNNKVAPNLGMALNIMGHFLADGYLSPTKRKGGRVYKAYGSISENAKQLKVLDVLPWHKNASVSKAIDSLNYLIAKTGDIQTLADFMFDNNLKNWDHLFDDSELGKSLHNNWKKNGELPSGFGSVNGNVLGPKVGDFMANMSGDYEQVTVDIHETRGGMRRLSTPFEFDARGKKVFREAPTDRERILLTASITDTAKLLGIDPMSAQAVSWGMEKGLYGSMLPNYDGEMYGFGRSSIAYGKEKTTSMNRTRVRNELKKAGLLSEDTSMVSGLINLNLSPGKNRGVMPGKMIDDATAAARINAGKIGDVGKMVATGEKKKGADKVTDRHIELWKEHFNVDEKHESVRILRKLQAGQSPTKDFLDLWKSNKREAKLTVTQYDPFTFYKQGPALFGGPGDSVYLKSISPADIVKSTFLAAKMVASGSVDMASKVFRSRATRIRRSGPIGQYVGETAVKASDTAGRVIGKFENEVVAMQRKLQGRGADVKPALDQLGALSPVVNQNGTVIAWSSSFVDAVEGRGNTYQNLNPLARQIVDLHRKVTRGTGLLAEAVGVTRMTPNGPVKFTASPQGKVFVRHMTEYGQSIMDVGPAHPDYRTFIEALSAMNNRNVSETDIIMSRLSAMPIHSRAAFEFFREFPLFPAAIRTSTGGVAHLLEVSPHNATAYMLARDAHRISYIGDPDTKAIHFAQDPGIAEQLRGNYIREAIAAGIAPEQAATDYDRLLRGVSGLSQYPVFNQWFSSINDASKGWLAVAGALVSTASGPLLLSGSAPIQITEGVGTILKHPAGAMEVIGATMRELAGSPLLRSVFDRAGKIADEERKIIEAGGIRPTMPIQWRLDTLMPSDSPPLQKAAVYVEHAIKVAGHVAYKGFLVEFANNLAPRIAARAANAMVEKVKAKAVPGRSPFTPAEMSMLFMIGYDRGVLRRLESGRYDMNDLNHLVAATKYIMSGHGGTSALKTPVSSNPAGKTLIKFQDYFTAVGRQVARSIEQIGTAFFAGRGSRTGAVASLTRLLAAQIGAGLAAVLVTALISGGLSGVSQEIQRGGSGAEGFAELGTKVLVQSTFGGLLGSVLRAFDLDPTISVKPQNPWDYLTSMFVPFRLVDNLYNYGAGKKQYDNMTAWDKTALFATKTIPGINRIGQGLAMFGLTDRDLGVESARSRFYRWYYRQPEGIAERPGSMSYDLDGQDVYLQKMKKAYLSIMEDDIAGARKHFEDALAEIEKSDKERNPAQSLGQRKLIPKLLRHDGMFERAKEQLGEETMSKISAHDELIDKFFQNY